MVKARPPTAINFIWFTPHLRHGKTHFWRKPGSFTKWEKYECFRFDPANGVGWRGLRSNGLEVAIGAAFSGPCLALEKLNATYDAMRSVSR